MNMPTLKSSIILLLLSSPTCHTPIILLLGRLVVMKAYYLQSKCHPTNNVSLVGLFQPKMVEAGASWR